MCMFVRCFLLVQHLLEHGTRIEITPARLPLDARVPMPVLVSGPTALLHRLAACDVRWYDPRADGVPALLSALRPLELSAEQRRRARVPPSARHMAYLHPLTQREPVTALRDAAASTGHLLAADALLAGRGQPVPNPNPNPNPNTPHP